VTWLQKLDLMLAFGRPYLRGFEVARGTGQYSPTWSSLRCVAGQIPGQ
jgi:hypothetical protein